MNAQLETKNRFFSYLIGVLIVFVCWHGFGEGASPIDLQKRFAAIASTANGKVGVAVELLETKESLQLNGQAHFPMQSVYKLPIAMAVLRQVDNGTLKLEQMVRVTTNDFVSELQYSPLRDAHPLGVELSVSNLLQLMVSKSDGTACDVLLRVLNGPPSVERYLRELGETNIVVVTTEKEMGQNEQAQYRNWSTPEGMVELLRLFTKAAGFLPPVALCC